MESKQDTNITWEDVMAVCKMMGARVAVYDGQWVIGRPNAIGSMFTDPAAALEYLSAEEHPLEQKYANILRTIP